MRTRERQQPVAHNVEPNAAETAKPFATSKRSSPPQPTDVVERGPSPFTKAWSVIGGLVGVVASIAAHVALPALIAIGAGSALLGAFVGLGLDSGGHHPSPPSDSSTPPARGDLSPEAKKNLTNMAEAAIGIGAAFLLFGGRGKHK